MARAVRLRVTVVMEYEADPADYGTDDPVAMAQIDQGNWEDDPLMLWSSFNGFDSITVEPVQ